MACRTSKTNDLSDATSPNLFRQEQLNTGESGGAVFNKGTIEFMSDAMFTGTTDVSMRVRGLFKRSFFDPVVNTGAFR